MMNMKSVPDVAGYLIENTVKQVSEIITEALGKAQQV